LSKKGPSAGNRGIKKKEKKGGGGGGGGGKSKVGAEKSTTWFTSKRKTRKGNKAFFTLGGFWSGSKKAKRKGPTEKNGFFCFLLLREKGERCVQWNIGVMAKKESPQGEKKRILPLLKKGGGANSKGKKNNSRIVSGPSFWDDPNKKQ